MGEDDWRIQIGPKEGFGLRIYARARTVVPNIEGNVLDGALVLYAGSLAMAQRVVAAQSADDICWSEIAEWDPTGALWHPVQSSGSPSVALADWQLPAAEVMPRTRRASVVAALDDRRWSPWIDGGLVLGLFGTLFVLVYFLGPHPSDPGPADKHDLALALAVAALCAIGFAAFVSHLRRR